MVSKCPSVHRVGQVPVFIDGKLNYFRVQETSSFQTFEEYGHPLSRRQRERHKNMAYLMNEIDAL